MYSFECSVGSVIKETRSLISMPSASRDLILSGLLVKSLTLVMLSSFRTSAAH